MPRSQMKLMMMYKEATFSLFHGPNLTIINWKEIIWEFFSMQP